jgi:glutamate transport system permease protein
MGHILIPQAARAMLPVIVSQLVVLVKDTALGYIISYSELLQLGVNNLAANFGNVVQAAIVAAAIYIAVNSTLTAVAGWLSRRTRRSGRAPRATTGPAVIIGATDPGMGGGGGVA